MKASCRAASLLAAGGWAWDFGIHLSLPHSVGRAHPTTPDLHLTTLYKFIIDLFHPLGRQHNGFGGCHRLAVVGAKGQHFLVDFSPQCALDARGSFIAHRGSPRGADDAQWNADHADSKRRGPCASSQPGPQRAAHNPSQRPHKGHIAQQAEPLAEYAPPHIPHGGGSNESSFLLIMVSSFHYIVLFWGGLLQRCVTRVLSGTARA